MERRDFLAATAALAGSRWLPEPAPRQARASNGKVILFQGDSITDCGRDRSVTEPNTGAGLGNGYPLLIASELLEARPREGLRFYNRGISGNKVPDLLQRWTADAIDLKPDVLTILIGVNDFWHKLGGGYSGTVQDYEIQYTTLVSQTRKALPHTHIVILEPFVLRCGAVDDRWFPEFDDRRAAAWRVANVQHATFVELQSVFDARARATTPEFWAADGVHPTPAGHGLLAERIRKAAKL
jgi:lysophospholipase L1-like esterase